MKKTNTASPASPGTRLSSGLRGSGRRIRAAHRPNPASVSVTTLTALVIQEQDDRALRHPPRVGAALHQQPGPHRQAARSAQGDRRPKGQLAEGDAGSEPDRGSVEDLQERENVAQARQDLQGDRRQDPSQLHVRDLIGDPVQARNRQQESRDERHEDRQRDQPAPQAPARILVVAAGAAGSAGPLPRRRRRGLRSDGGRRSPGSSPRRDGASAGAGMLDNSISDPRRTSPAPPSSACEPTIPVRSRSPGRTRGSSVPTRPGWSTRVRHWTSTCRGRDRGGRPPGWPRRGCADARPPGSRRGRAGDPPAVSGGAGGGCPGGRRTSG